MIPREAQSKYVSDVMKIHLFLQDILTLLANNTRKSSFIQFMSEIKSPVGYRILEYFHSIWHSDFVFQ